MADVELNGKKIGDLKVLEIKDELGNRGLNKKGLKAVLVRRLASAVVLEKKAEVSLSMFDTKFLLGVCVGVCVEGWLI